MVQMRPFLAGFADELIKLSVDAGAAGTGISAPPTVKTPTAPKPMTAPKFSAPPGLKTPRITRPAIGGAKLPSGAPKLPTWQSPGARG